MYDSVLLRAVQKREQLEEDLPNLYFIRMDARNLPDVFEKGEVDKIYLNFRTMAEGASCKTPSDFPPVFGALRQDPGTGGNGRVQDR